PCACPRGVPAPAARNRPPTRAAPVPTAARTARTDRTSLHLPDHRNLGTAPMKAVPPAALACVAVRPLAPCSPGDACAGIGAPVAGRHVAGGPSERPQKSPAGRGGRRGSGNGTRGEVLRSGSAPGDGRRSATDLASVASYMTTPHIESS